MVPLNVPFFNFLKLAFLGFQSLKSPTTATFFAFSAGTVNVTLQTGLLFKYCFLIAIIISLITLQMYVTISLRQIEFYVKHNFYDIDKKGHLKINTSKNICLIFMVLLA